MALKAIEGKKKILMFRKLSEAKLKDASKLALQTEHSWSKSANTSSTQTKDGAINVSGGLETTLSISAVASYDDVNKFLEEAVDNSDVLEVWDIDLSEVKEGKYKARYAQGLLNKWETPAGVEDLVTFDTEMNINMLPQDGFTELTDSQEEEVQYAFREVTKFVTTP